MPLVKTYEVTDVALALAMGCLTAKTAKGRESAAKGLVKLLTQGIVYITVEQAAKQKVYKHSSKVRHG